MLLMSVKFSLGKPTGIRESFIQILVRDESHGARTIGKLRSIGKKQVIV